MNIEQIKADAPKNATHYRKDIKAYLCINEQEAHGEKQTFTYIWSDGWIDAKPQPSEELISLTEKEPEIFTHSYWGEGESELNPVKAYFQDAQIVKVTKHAGNSIKTAECSQLMRDGYVFCQWLGIDLCLAIYVKPSQQVRDYVKKVYGYKTEAMTINEANRVIWGGVEDTIRHKVDAIAGDFDRDEFNSFVVDCLYQTNSPYMYFWIGKITKQPTVIDDFKRGHFKYWWRFSANTHFIRSNWKISNQSKCLHCGRDH